MMKKCEPIETDPSLYEEEASMADGPECMTIEEFAASVGFGAFNDHDGSAYYSTGREADSYRDDPVDFDNILTPHPKGLTHVLWFGK